ncbi:MAG: twitching motility protein PilT, partial [Thermoleophilaceae bacterium]|nr:twitching motility protein PilT [Thermoleophilaceae bacterium]
MNFDFADFLIVVIEAGASVLHLTAGSPPMVREQGRLRPLDYPQMTPQDTREIVYSILNNE